MNQATDVHGILVQLPLPLHLDEREICNIVRPEKDVDGFTAHNLGCLVQAVHGVKDNGTHGSGPVWPCTTLAVKRLLEAAATVAAASESGPNSPEQQKKIFFQGKTAVVVGRSLNVGLPIALVLQVVQTPKKLLVPLY